MKAFCIIYNHRGVEWGLELRARDATDAAARLRAIGINGRVEGELILAVPVSLGWWIPVVCWFRNLFAGRA